MNKKIYVFVLFFIMIICVPVYGKETIDINKNPENQYVRISGVVCFEVQTNNDKSQYQWYYKSPKNEKWEKVSGEKSRKPILRFVAKRYMNQYKYRCQIKIGKYKKKQ